jgi:hypothetical protein
MGTAAINWKPLEDLIGDDKASDFMYMGTARSDSEIHLYKHYATRRYLNISEDGKTWKYVPAGSTGFYERLDQQEAIRQAYS